MAKTDFEIEIVRLVLSKRISLKLSQAKIAKIIKVTPGYIGQIEMHSTSSMYSYEQLNELAISFNCSPKDFIPEIAK